jgi:hypothetical protein
MLETERAKTSAAGAGVDARVARAMTHNERAVGPAELAWIALLPCAIVATAAIVLLGPPLGHALLRPGGNALWPPTWWEAQGRPEPIEHGRFVLALLAPFAFVGVLLAGFRRLPRLPSRAVRPLVVAGQVGVAAFIAAAVLGEHGAIDFGHPQPPIFDIALLAIAAGLVLVAVIAMRADRTRAAIARISRERSWLRIACAMAAVVVAATWLLEAIETDRLVEEGGLWNWTLNDVFAVLNGHDPLVDYHPVYAKLLPYPAALALLALGTTGFVYTLFMTALSLLALLAVYGVLRRVTPSALLALGLFVPFVALSDVRHTMLMPAMWPMRYGGAYLLAWLTARHLDGRRPQHVWTLFLVAGVVTINDLEFGLAAALASVAALLCARPARSRRDLLRLGGAVGCGALLAIAAVSLFMLARAGSLPRPALLLEWPQIFADLGWFSLPMPSVGLHLVVYATFAAAVAVAVVRVASGAGDRLLTAMIAWSGVFGLLASGYYAGRSEPVKLAALLSAWGFALVLLTVLCVRALSERAWRSPTIAELLVLLGFGLSICTIGQLVSPVMLIRRLTAPLPPPQYRPIAEGFIAPHVRPGEKVVILLPESFRLAYELGVDNVAPYQSQNAIVTRDQMQTLLATLEREQVAEVFMPLPGSRLQGEVDAAPEHVQQLGAAGYALGASAYGMLELQRVRD